MLDHVIALNEPHLRRLIRDYVNYHHDDRTHDSLHKDAPNHRPIEHKPSPEATLISHSLWVVSIIGTPGERRLRTIESPTGALNTPLGYLIVS